MVFSQIVESQMKPQYIQWIILTLLYVAFCNIPSVLNGLDHVCKLSVHRGRSIRFRRVKGKILNLKTLFQYCYCRINDE